MDNNKTNLPSKELTSQDVIEFFNDFKPTTKDDSIGVVNKMKPYLKKLLERISNESKNFLIKRCGDCPAHIDSNNKLAVQRILTHKLQYNDTQINNWEKEIEQLVNQVSARKSYLKALFEGTQDKESKKLLLNEDGSDKVVKVVDKDYFKGCTVKKAKELIALHEAKNKKVIEI